MNSNSTFRRKLGAALKKQRIKKEVKQLTVATEIKVSESYISKLENGKIPIQLIILLNYCAVLNLTMADFMDLFKDFF